MTEIAQRTRSSLIAGFLSLLGAPIGHVYCGRILRAATFWCIGLLLVPLIAFLLVTFPFGRIGLLILLGIGMSVPFVQAIDAALIARSTPRSPTTFAQRWWIYLLLVAIAYILNYGLAIFVKSNIAEVFMVPTRGMAPTIEPGDRILVDKFWTHPNRLGRNDVVVFETVESPTTLYVMRVVGFSNEDLRIEGMRFFVNDQEVSVPEAHLNATWPQGILLPPATDRKVASESLFVVGDNLNLSRDSRTFGDVPIRNLYGTALAVLWSRPRIFPDPDDTRNFTLGPIAWDRIGMSLLPK
jgi:signal peptidase I